MKKIILLLSLILPIVANAQKSPQFDELAGTFTLPETEKYVTLKFDCSKTVFEKKYNEADWILLIGEKEWEEAKQEAMERIVKMMNEKMTKTRLILVLENMAIPGNPELQPNFTLYIIPKMLYKNGRNVSQFVLKDNNSNAILGSIYIKGTGAHFGSLGNMLGDGYESSAPDVAKLLVKYNKRR